MNVVLGLLLTAIVIFVVMLRVLIPTSNLSCYRIRLLTGLNMGGKTHNIAIQLVL